MKTFFSFCIAILVIPSLLVAQTGKVFDNLTFKSKILNMDRKYSVYLPSDYEISNRSYPVLYLLHGSGDNQSSWIQFGEVNTIADKAIAEGKSAAMIIVMIDATTGRSGYFNTLRGDYRYEDFFFQEFIPYIEKTYRIHAEKQFRAISGNSLGGWGTMIYALHHPEMFAAACPLSAYIRVPKVNSGNTPADISLRRNTAHLFWIPADTIGISASQIDQYENQLDAFYLIENMPDSQKSQVRWYFDCGDDDFLYEGNAMLHIALRKKEIPHEYRIRDGGHGWKYWREALPEVLNFVTQGFHRN